MKGGKNGKKSIARVLSGCSVSLCIIATICGIYIVINDVYSVTALLAIFSINIVAICLLCIALFQKKSRDEDLLSHTKANEDFRYAQILTLINNLADAILSLDSKGEIHLYNAAALNLLDTNTSLNGRSINDVLSLHDCNGEPIDGAALIRSARGVTVRDDLVLQIAKDESMRLEITFSPIRSSVHAHGGSEEDNGSIVILRDITKAKSLEEERDEFISVVSHELRTPITITEGTISNLQLMHERGLLTGKKATEAIKNAHDQILFLASMVNDLSMLSRAERGVADDPEEIDVKELVHSLYNEYAPQAEAKKLHFNLDADTKLGTIFSSRLYVQELLQNFITNAIKYTRDGSITLEVRIKQAKAGAKVEFSVRDSGIGISKTDLVKIFQKFYRAEDYRTRETSGTGLGLYVSAKLAKKLGTRIDVTSRLNHGSCFKFSLPLSGHK